MSTYTRTETVEAMQWHDDHDDHDGSDTSIFECAREIVDWVNEQGGLARYEADLGDNEDVHGTPYPRIAVRTAEDTWVFAAPGDWIVMGNRFVFATERTSPKQIDWRNVRAFSVVRAADWAAQGWSS